MNRIEQIFLIGLGLTIGLAHWTFYVNPADEHRFCVMSCMGSDNSHEAYNECIQEIEAGRYVCE
jgi:hypothetical protein